MATIVGGVIGGFFYGAVGGLLGAVVGAIGSLIYILWEEFVGICKKIASCIKNAFNKVISMFKVAEV